MGRKKQKPHTLLHLTLKRLMREREADLNAIACRLTEMEGRTVTYAQLWRRITNEVTTTETIQLIGRGLGMARSALLRAMETELASAKNEGIEVTGLELVGRISFNSYCREKLRRQPSPIPSFGGKGRDTHRLLDQTPPHHTYVEVFGGAASLLFSKDPSPVDWLSTM